jgi:hypothetical protein
MTTFTKANLNFDGMYLHYVDEFMLRHFVARFKRRGDAGTFITFLIKNFTVDEYFDMLAGGVAPLTIVQSKGYLQPHIKKWLREGGYPVTPEGYRAFFDAQVLSRTKAVA